MDVQALEIPPPGFLTASLDKVESEIARQMTAEQDPDGPPIQRARMSNLVIYCDEPAIATSVLAEVPAIAAVHPARVILIDGRPQRLPDRLTAAVDLRTRYVHGGRQEVGSEQIYLAAGGDDVTRIPSVVRGLLIGDLPTNLWWASHVPPPLAGPLLFDLAESAQQVIYDSLGWREPHRGVSATSNWLAHCERDGSDGHWRVASDLNWRRLKLWRRLISQTLDPATAEGAIDSISEISIEHGPHAVTQAWQLAAWLASRLGWRVQARQVRLGVEISWNFIAPWGLVKLRIQRLPEGPSIIHRVRIACDRCGENGAYNLVNQDETRLSVVPEGTDAATRTIAARPVPLAELVGRQLTDRERDPVFNDVMSIAQSLAQGVG